MIMKKFPLTLLGLTAIMTVAGCDSVNKVSAAAVEKFMTPPTDLIVNVKSVSIAKGKKYALKTQIRPLAAWDAKLSYASSDESVATVDENGIISGLKGGHAVISVFSTDYFVDAERTPKLIEDVDVYVYGTITGQSKADQVAEMAAIEVSKPDSVRLYDYRIYDLICEGVSQDRSEEYQTYVVSQSEGLMAYDSQEVYINVTNGGKSYDEYGYTCHTKSSYASYMFHRNSSVKNVFYIATEFNAGKASRFETMCQILDSYFTVANDYFTGSLDDVITPIFDYDTVSQYTGQLFAGSYKSGNEFGITLHYNETDDEVTSIEDEVRYATQLPAGIQQRTKFSIVCTIVNGYVIDYLQTQSSSFKWNGKNYKYDVTLARRTDIIDSDEVAKYIPNLSEYNNVEYYYDI